MHTNILNVLNKKFRIKIIILLIVVVGILQYFLSIYPFLTLIRKNSHDHHHHHGHVQRTFYIRTPVMPCNHNSFSVPLRFSSVLFVVYNEWLNIFFITFHLFLQKFPHILEFLFILILQRTHTFCYLALFDIKSFVLTICLVES